MTNILLRSAVRVGPPPTFEPQRGTEFTLDADLVLIDFWASFSPELDAEDPDHGHYAVVVASDERDYLVIDPYHTLNALLLLSYVALRQGDEAVNRLAVIMRGGDYTFHVIGSNNDGVWNTTGVALKIHITPPFWQTWWFRLVAACLALGVAAVVVSARLRYVAAAHLSETNNTPALAQAALARAAVTSFFTMGWRSL